MNSKFCVGDLVCYKFRGEKLYGIIRDIDTDIAGEYLYEINKGNTEYIALNIHEQNVLDKYIKQNLSK